MKKRAILVIAAALLIAILFILSNPVRAIRVSAVLHGCSKDEVMSTGFVMDEQIDPHTSMYKAVGTVLPDKLTGSGHQTWHVYSFLFLNIPVWAGNG